MEFWGVEVKAGEKLKVQPEFGKLIHISQAAIGEVKDVKGAKNVHLRMKIDDKNFVIGSLSAEDRPQVMFDLVFEKDFELSHDLKNGSIYFIGYVAEDPISEGEVDSDDEFESEDEGMPFEVQENGTAKAKAGGVKPAGEAKKEQKVAKKVEDSDDDDDDEDDSEDEMALDGMLEDSSDVSGDSDEESEDDSSEQKVPLAAQSKKRPAESAEKQKTPLAKKAKSATPEKSGKKGQNATTPVPSKSAGKTPNKAKEQTPKSAGQVTCKSCTKTFSSGNAMESHAKAKHGGK